ncbi:MAG: zf-HC2 domain-containing protein [Treponema sp.]|jgi:hypothetical protein|nr:zf-HC2 domain-containing protein [Treponema sp.]
MCPDRQILSVYHDGELPSPWKEKMEAHLELCPECRARLDRYRTLFRNLRAKENSPEALVLKERIWRGLNEKIRSPGLRPRRFWIRTVPVPLPAAAAAVLVFVLALLFAGRPFAKVQDIPVATGMGVDLQNIPASDLNGVLRYLGGEDSADIVIIRLPESKSFTSLGEPALIRAADYSRSGAHR